jgi:putative ABC transport system permease protein
MIWSYLVIAWRNLLKNKINTLINILGLAVGFSVSVLILIYVYHQVSFDQFHENKVRIYRMTLEDMMSDGKTMKAAISSGEVAREILNNVPGVEHATRVYDWGDDEVFVGDQRYINEKTAWADTGFFRVFTFPLIRGNPNTALNEMFSVVLSEKLALKYFGNADALNQTIRIEDDEYRVTGIMKNWPENSHIFYDAIASFSSLERTDYNIVERDGISFPTYVMLAEGVDRDAVTARVREVADKVLEDRYGPMGIKAKTFTQPLMRAYLYSDFMFTDGKKGDIRNVYIFSFLAFFIILIAVFNFINLMTAQLERRMKEIGLRKVVGAGRRDVIRQFIGESVLVALIAFVLSLGLNEILLQPFSSLMDEQFRLEYWHQLFLLPAIILFVIITGILSGIYPALYLSSFRPIRVLKGSVSSTGRKHTLRKVLVTLQFAISVFLIVSLFLLHAQTKFMKTKDLGFQREGTLALRMLTDQVRLSYKSIRAELLQNPNIVSVTASQSIPGQSRSMQNCYKKGDDPRSAIIIHENRVQHDYIETYGLNIINGRGFNKEMKTDTAAFVINEKAAEKLGLQNPIGQEIFVWNMSGKIIGVVSDYNFMSLHSEIDPLVLTMYSKWFRQISVRIRPENVSETMDYIRETMKEADPNYTFEYVFVDEKFAQMYKKEERMNHLFSSSAILAVIISILGIYALTSFTVGRKIKEIGIRKAMGASVSQIVGMLFADLSKWILLGNIIAWPLAFWLIKDWLGNFAYRIELMNYWWVFPAAALIAVGVGALAMFYQSYSAARSNPVDALRYE